MVDTTDVGDALDPAIASMDTCASLRRGGDGMRIGVVS